MWKAGATSCLPLADLVAAPQRLLAWDSSTHPTSPPNGGNCPRYWMPGCRLCSTAPWCGSWGAMPIAASPWCSRPTPARPNCICAAIGITNARWPSDILQRCRATPDPSAATNIDPPTIRHWLDRLFPASPAPPPKTPIATGKNWPAPWPCGGGRPDHRRPRHGQNLHRRPPAGPAVCHRRPARPTARGPGCAHRQSRRPLKAIHRPSAAGPAHQHRPGRGHCRPGAAHRRSPHPAQPAATAPWAGQHHHPAGGRCAHRR